MSLKVGFIGCGGVARGHIARLAQMDDVELVAFCDNDRERARQCAKTYGGKPFARYSYMLRRVPLDAVYICTPPFAHGPQEKALIEADIPFFVEKPIAVNARTALRIAEGVTKRNLITAVGYQDRYLDIIDYLKSFLQGRKLGLVMGYWMGGMPGVPWWRVKKLSGGQAVEQTTHIFDTCRNLFGEISKVYATYTVGLMTDVPDYNVEDASAVTLEFESGLTGVIFSACFVSVNGRSGVDGWGKDFSFEYRERTSLKLIEPGRVLETSVRNEYGYLCDRAFVEAVLTDDGSKVRSDYLDALRTLLVTLAANKSMASGKPVKIEPV